MLTLCGDYRGAPLVQYPRRVAPFSPIQRRLYQGALGRFAVGFECYQLLPQLENADKLCVTLV